jgi:hypothetical protein
MTPSRIMKWEAHIARMEEGRRRSKRILLIGYWWESQKERDH